MSNTYTEENEDHFCNHDDDMEEDDALTSKKRRSVLGPLAQPPLTAFEGVLVLADKTSKVADITLQFESGIPPSPVPVRDPKRKKTGEDVSSNDTAKNGALAGFERSITKPNESIQLELSRSGQCLDNS
jgi:hypothetical protein